MGLPLNLQWATGEGEPIPLNYMLPSRSCVSDWVLKKVKEIQHFWGMECEGYELQFMALFTTIEVDHMQITKFDLKKK